MLLSGLGQVQAADPVGVVLTEFQSAMAQRNLGDLGGLLGTDFLMEYISVTGAPVPVSENRETYLSQSDGMWKGGAKLAISFDGGYTVTEAAPNQLWWAHGVQVHFKQEGTDLRGNDSVSLLVRRSSRGVDKYELVRWVILKE